MRSRPSTILTASMSCTGPELSSFGKKLLKNVTVHREAFVSSPAFPTFSLSLSAFYRGFEPPLDARACVKRITSTLSPDARNRRDTADTKQTRCTPSTRTCARRGSPRGTVCSSYKSRTGRCLRRTHRVPRLYLLPLQTQ